METSPENEALEKIENDKIVGSRLGWGGVVVVFAAILIVAAIALQNNQYHIIKINETAACDMLRTINRAQMAFFTTHGKYSSNFDSLVTQGFLSQSKFTFQKLEPIFCEFRKQPTYILFQNGYCFIVQTDNGNECVYTVDALPISNNSSSGRHFYTDGTGVIVDVDAHQESWQEIE